MSHLKHRSHRNLSGGNLSRNSYKILAFFSKKETIIPVLSEIVYDTSIWNRGKTDVWNGNKVRALNYTGINE
jgi:hypothetical protein